MNEIIHIGFLVSRLNKGGPNNQLYLICKYLNTANFKATIFTLEKTDVKAITLHNDLNVLEIQIIELQINSYFQLLFKGPALLQKHINDLNIKIVQSYGYRSDFLASTMKNCIKITTIREILLNNFSNKHNKLLGKIFLFFKIIILKRFDQIIACSDSVRLNLDQISLSSITIKDSLDINEGNNKIEVEQNASYNPEITSHKPISFVTISSKLPGKNVEFLIKSFALNKSLAHYKLTVAGNISKSLIDKYSEYKNIEFIGWVENIKSVYLRSNYFISASVTEGMPNAVLEALSVGVPVVLSNIPPHIEIMSSTDSVVGKLFINNDEMDLVNKIQDILNEDYRTMSLNGRNLIVNRFDAKTMSLEYQKKYLSLNFID